MKVTKPPIECIEKVGGRYKGTYTVEIDGEQYSVSAEGATRSSVKSRLGNERLKKFKNSKHGHAFLASSDADAVIGSGPKQVTPGEVLNRNQVAESVQKTLDSDMADEEDEETPLSRRANTIVSVPLDEEKIMIKGSPPNHLPWKVTGQGTTADGQGESIFREPLPENFQRPGDTLILCKNSNALIHLGRDMAPSNKQKNSKSIFDREYNSGFSNHMGSGMIGLTVGKMAPFAMEQVSGETPTLGPSFNTSRPPELLQQQLLGGKHPGWCMDAATIYISQMTTIDHNFNITKKIRDSYKETNELAPTSGIMLKADKLRLHSRQDLKLVTGGPREPVNSHGNPLITNSGIHIIAENGQDREGKELPQHPMVLGDNLLECLNQMLVLMKQINDRVDSFISYQLNFNTTIGFGFDLLPVPYATSLRSPNVTWGTIVATIAQNINRIEGLFVDVNNFARTTNYLIDGSPKFINSKHNTVN